MDLLAADDRIKEVMECEKLVFLYDSCLLSKPDLNLRRPLKG